MDQRLNDCYNDFLRNDVLVFSGSYHFSGSADAAVIKSGNSWGVFLDIDKIRTPRQELHAVVHEWSHWQTDSTYGLDAPPAVKKKAEETARRAEIKKLLPFDKMRGVIRGGITQIYELSEYFNVDEDMIRQALAYYTGPCGLTFA